MKCDYFMCKAQATIRVPSASRNFCEDHYLLNIARFGCDLKGVAINKNGKPKKRQPANSAKA